MCEYSTPYRYADDPEMKTLTKALEVAAGLVRAAPRDLPPSLSSGGAAKKPKRGRGGGRKGSVMVTASASDARGGDAGGDGDGGDDGDTAETFQCAINRHCVTDPVISPEGVVFERATILHWLEVRFG